MGKIIHCFKKNAGTTKNTLGYELKRKKYFEI